VSHNFKSPQRMLRTPNQYLVEIAKGITDSSALMELLDHIPDEERSMFLDDITPYLSFDI
jgi:hypothetical protein